MPYALGAVKPNVRDAAETVGKRFNVSTIYGVGSREIANSDHPKGLALDFMVGSDYTKGDAIAAFMQANASHYHVTYIIWKQRIWNVGRASEGWRSMPDRGGITANHYDHVHVSFAGGNWFTDTKQNITGNKEALKDTLVPDQLKQIADVVKFLTDSHNWLRVGTVLLGFVLVLIGLALVSQKAVPKQAVSLARKVVK